MNWNLEFKDLFRISDLEFRFSTAEQWFSSMHKTRNRVI